MVDYTDADGDCLFASLDWELQKWANGDPDGPLGGVPYSYDGDDGRGHGASREQFDWHLSTPVRHLVLLLEADGRSMAADMLRKAFEALAAQAVLMDEWCEGRPVPEELENDNWPPAIVFDAVGDPGMRVLENCYRTIEEIREIVAAKAELPAAPAAAIPIVHRSPAGDTVEWERKVYPVPSNWADAFDALIAAKGMPVGISKYLGHTRDGLRLLKAKAPPLFALLQKADGKKGYFLKSLDT